MLVQNGRSLAGKSQPACENEGSRDRPVMMVCPHELDVSCKSDQLGLNFEQAATPGLALRDRIRQRRDAFVTPHRSWL